jgi:hypothetical protein
MEYPLLSSTVCITIDCMDISWQMSIFRQVGDGKKEYKRKKLQ